MRFTLTLEDVRMLAVFIRQGQQTELNRWVDKKTLWKWSEGYICPFSRHPESEGDPACQFAYMDEFQDCTCKKKLDTNMGSFFDHIRAHIALYQREQPGSYSPVSQQLKMAPYHRGVFILDPLTPLVPFFLSFLSFSLLPNIFFHSSL